MGAAQGIVEGAGGASSSCACSAGAPCACGGCTSAKQTPVASCAEADCGCSSTATPARLQPGDEDYTEARPPRVRQAPSSRDREVIYRLDEECDRDGKVIRRTEHGSPFVVYPDFGIAPAEVTRGITDDGRRVEISSGGVYDSKTRTFRKHMEIALHRGAPVPESAEDREVRRARRWERRKQQALDDLETVPTRNEEKGYDLKDPQVVLTVRLKGDELADIPPRMMLGPAFERYGRSDHLTPLRKERIAKRIARHEVTVHEFVHWARGNGWEVSVESTVWEIWVQLIGRLAGAKEVLGHPLVCDVTVSASDVLETKDGFTIAEQRLGCQGRPSPYEKDLDGEEHPQCQDPSQQLYMDGLHLATGVNPYFDAGLRGAGPTASGFANWAVQEDDLDGRGSSASVPHLAVMVSERGFQFFPTHPAFAKPDGTSRVNYFLTEDGFVSTNMAWVPTGGEWHAGVCAAVAMADVTRGQDDDASGHPWARSGVAGLSLGFWASTRIHRAIEALATGSVDGADILTNSENGNSGTCSPAQGCDTSGQSLDGDVDRCPLEDEARGVDHRSLSLINAHFIEGLVTAKSAGNMGAHDDYLDCTGGLRGGPYQVSRPGAAPTTLSVGASNDAAGGAALVPSDLQGFRGSGVDRESSGGETPDGRAYPMLITHQHQCGAAAKYTSLDEPRYREHGATSAAAPRVAGSAALVKHWMLDAHGPLVGNVPGSVIAAVLNMADGYAFSLDPRERAEVPTPSYGLGRLQMRLLTPAGMDGDFGYGNMAVNMGGNQSVDFVVAVPDATVRFVMTIWWAELNVGGGERKAEVTATLDYDHGRRVRRASGNSVIRFQYDCEDTLVYDSPISGDVYVEVRTGDVPVEQRGCELNARSIHVSWYYETAQWRSRVTCGEEPSNCKGVGEPSEYERGPELRLPESVETGSPAPGDMDMCELRCGTSASYRRNAVFCERMCMHATALPHRDMHIDEAVRQGPVEKPWFDP